MGSVDEGKDHLIRVGQARNAERSGRADVQPVSEFEQALAEVWMRVQLESAEAHATWSGQFGTGVKPSEQWFVTSEVSGVRPIPIWRHRLSVPSWRKGVAAGETSHNRKLSSGSFHWCRPRDRFLIVLTADEATMHDTDEAIAERAQRLMV